MVCGVSELVSDVSTANSPAGDILRAIRERRVLSVLESLDSLFIYKLQHLRMSHQNTTSRVYGHML